MNEHDKDQLTAIFRGHTSAVDSAAHARETRGQNDRRQEVEFSEAFAAHCTDVILPVLEDYKREICENGHGATVTSSTHGKFFSGPDRSPGVVFMFYPGTVSPGDFVFKPHTSHLAIFGAASTQKVQVYSKVELPGGFTPAKLPDLLPLSEVTAEFLSTLCLRLVADTLHRVQPRLEPQDQARSRASGTGPVTRAD